jgi:hypothetical protein
VQQARPRLQYALHAGTGGHGGDMFPPPCDAECMRQQPSVLDVVKVPAVKPGRYVLGFRYDCDATAQVWSNCADIMIV